MTDWPGGRKTPALQEVRGVCEQGTLVDWSEPGWDTTPEARRRGENGAAAGLEEGDGGCLEGHTPGWAWLSHQHKVTELHPDPLCQMSCPGLPEQAGSQTSSCMAGISESQRENKLGPEAGLAKDMGLTAVPTYLQNLGEAGLRRSPLQKCLLFASGERQKPSGGDVLL